jgi:protein SCO1/2
VKPHIEIWIVIGAALATPAAARAGVADPLPSALQGVDVVEKLGDRVPDELRFVDSNGRPVRLGDYLHHGRPAILTLVYYQCPMLCSLVLNGVVEALKKIPWKLGSDFDLITVSFDPADRPAVAAEKRRGYLQALGESDAGSLWPFLTGAPEEVRALADAVGFKYNYVPSIKQFAHTTAIFVLCADGSVSRYLYGVQFPQRDLRLALAEAGRGRAGPSFDRVLLSCFRYNPASRRYALFVSSFFRTGGALVFLAMAIFIGRYWRNEGRAGLRGRGGSC